MGDPKKNRKKYAKPVHPWQKERIDQEKEFIKEYGLKNKKEIWRMRAPLEHFKTRVKGIISKSGAEADEEQVNLIHKLHGMGLVEEGAQLSDVLSLTVKDVLERRLQTVIFRKGLARTISQARQFITHEHITVGGKTINAPSYLVTRADEETIAYVASSALSNPDHPEISTPVETPGDKPEVKAEEKKAEPKGEKKAGKKDEPAKAETKKEEAKA